MTDMFLWTIEGSMPPTETKKWRHNINIQVFSPTLEKAVEAVKEKYPDLLIIKVFRDRSINDVIIGGQND